MFQAGPVPSRAIGYQLTGRAAHKQSRAGGGDGLLCPTYQYSYPAVSAALALSPNESTHDISRASLVISHQEPSSLLFQKIISTFFYI